MPSVPPPFPAHPRARGVTLIEAVLFISVALGLIVGGIVFYRQASEAARVGNQVRVLSAIVAELRAAVNTNGLDGFDGLGVNSGSLSGGLDEYLAASGALPADVIRPPGPNTATLSTSWETPLLIGYSMFAQGQQQGSSNPVFTIWLQRLPIAACARLSIVDAGGAGVFSDGVVGAAVHNVKPFPVEGLAPLMLPPISPADAAVACEAADTNDDGTVSLLFEIAVYG